MSLSFEVIIDIYSFADQRVIPNLQDAAVNAWRQRMVETEAWDVAAQSIGKLYESSSESCKFRKLLVRAFAQMSDSSAWQSNYALPSDFAVSVLNETMVDLKRIPDHRARQQTYNYRLDMKLFAEMNLCQYHEHQDEAHCDLS